ncbi:hypothetical protein [Paraburkholderia caballeronis]|uniref:Tfp pilus assembly protein PilO n=1 Tax=Paraburkholderia caballeronis TaxID=416943 RepID=A0A1H7UWX5_9BURK|nr:hypothetical protein [Paraburkholderia caballeronis]PXW17403.1 hypothetical protein C7403_11955 [Paraburkholderia caballeronis]PXW94855.1 hypothetical protein C7407_11955 [Paraburkholderia caballeronis]RAJ90753.1 hypothetical protein C7409_11955 [Paraburkholderia caballeronis]SEB56193.1 hypothetical protein SAMN05445871_0573 [Paraburkholderia caballeronis]SEM01531.1 hypothetical protein SAMN05192542_12147 [Paraburkholderia caballeronis]
MSDAMIRRVGGMGPRFSAGSWLRGWMPLYAWSARRRMAVAAAIATASCVLAAVECVTTDVAGLAHAEAALADARHSLADAQQAQRELPALTRRAAASAVPGGKPIGGSSADDTRRVSELAAASGISLMSVEPGAAAAHGDESFRALKLVAQGDFARLRGFLLALASAPTLIVPAEIAVKRSGSGLSIAMTLSVFDSLPALADIGRRPGEPGEPGEPSPSDPFAAIHAGGPVAPDDALRLVGLMQDRAHAIALIETPDGTDAVTAGGRIEGGRVTRIAATGVTLASNGGAARELNWTEVAR